MEKLTPQQRWECVHDLERLFRAGAFLEVQPTDYAVAGLQEVAERFEKNRQRIRHLINLICVVHHFSRELQHLYVAERIARGLSINPETGDSIRPQEMLKTAFEKWVNEGLSWVPAALEDQDLYLHLSGIAAFHYDEVQSGIRAFCGSLIIQSWTAFESLAEDLWEGAVNSMPEKLAKGTISVDWFKKHGFDPKKLGTIIKEAGRDFRSLDGIKNEYKATFDRKNTKIMDILSSESLRYTAEVRHVLVHKAGRIDRDYLNKTSGIHGAFQSEVGAALPLNGQYTQERCDAALSAALDLLDAVNAWIIGHRPEEKTSS